LSKTETLNFNPALGTYKENTMNTAANLINVVKSSYTVAVMAVLGVFAFISAVLIAWPALAYLASKLFN
jgi:hypothetical protein